MKTEIYWCGYDVSSVRYLNSKLSLFYTVLPFSFLRWQICVNVYSCTVEVVTGKWEVLAAESRAFGNYQCWELCGKFFGSWLWACCFCLQHWRSKQHSFNLQFNQNAQIVHMIFLLFWLSTNPRKLYCMGSHTINIFLIISIRIKDNFSVLLSGVVAKSEHWPVDLPNIPARNNTGKYFC